MNRTPEYLRRKFILVAKEPFSAWPWQYSSGFPLRGAKGRVRIFSSYHSAHQAAMELNDGRTPHPALEIREVETWRQFRV